MCPAEQTTTHTHTQKYSHAVIVCPASAASQISVRELLRAVTRELRCRVSCLQSCSRVPARESCFSAQFETFIIKCSYRKGRHAVSPDAFTDVRQKDKAGRQTHLRLTQILHVCLQTRLISPSQPRHDRSLQNNHPERDGKSEGERAENN